MKRLLFEAFIDYYNKFKKFPLNIYTPPKKMNNKQLKSKYNKYNKIVDKMCNKSINKDIEKDKCVKKICMKRSENKCEIWPILSDCEREIVKERLFEKIMMLDPIHIIGRSNKNLRWNPENIIIGMRYFHSCIDQYIDPINNKTMTSKERDDWFIRIIGKERFNKLSEAM